MLVFLVLPVAGISLLLAASAIGVPNVLAMPGTAAVSGYLLAQERAVRRMTSLRRAVWAVVGCLLTAAVAAAVSLAIFLALVLSWCAGC